MVLEADVRRFCHQIKPDDVSGAHRWTNYAMDGLFAHTPNRLTAAQRTPRRLQEPSRQRETPSRPPTVAVGATLHFTRRNFDGCRTVGPKYLRLRGNILTTAMNQVACLTSLINVEESQEGWHLGLFIIRSGRIGR